MVVFKGTYLNEMTMYKHLHKRDTGVTTYVIAWMLQTRNSHVQRRKEDTMIIFKHSKYL